MARYTSLFPRPFSVFRSVWLKSQCYSATLVLPAIFPARAAARSNDNDADLTAAYTAFSSSLPVHDVTEGTEYDVELDLPSALALIRAHGVRLNTKFAYI